MVASEHCYGSITEELRGSLTHKWWSGTLLCDRIYPECEKYESKHSRQQSCPQLGYYSASCCGPNHRPLTREVSSRGPTWGAGWGRLTEALRPGLWSCRDLPAPGCAFPSGRSPRGPSWRAGGALGDEKGQAPGTGLGQPGVLGPH